jgi:hypothetical protein
MYTERSMYCKEQRCSVFGSLTACWHHTVIMVDFLGAQNTQRPGSLLFRYPRSKESCAQVSVLCFREGRMSQRSKSVPNLTVITVKVTSLHRLPVNVFLLPAAAEDTAVNHNKSKVTVVLVRLFERRIIPADKKRHGSSLSFDRHLYIQNDGRLHSYRIFWAREDFHAKILLVFCAAQQHNSIEQGRKEASARRRAGFVFFPTFLLLHHDPTSSCCRATVEAVPVAPSNRPSSVRGKHCRRGRRCCNSSNGACRHRPRSGSTRTRG